ncbi:hypothetical protein L0U85_04800 [Glycomyces sp. L485]|uniref:hypothetical protein n=1 Tax=Glycomyces sp. L485 TaxID=2909235 RepID=UPI001F4AE73B|nr:hypothetical protein [Glycomyces sp. L485]MCH7230184.1 hypothetical protein [Glycomyces sp. L485]
MGTGEARTGRARRELQDDGRVLKRFVDSENLRVATVQRVAVIGHGHETGELLVQCGGVEAVRGSSPQDLTL